MIQALPMIEPVLAHIREFEIEDIDKILEIEAEAFPKSAYSEEIFLQYAKKCSDGFFVVEAGDHVVGYIIFDMSGHIHSAAVKRSHRRKGFGTMLFNHALKTAKSRLWLEVRSKNVGAIGFYRRLGMRIVGEIPDYYETDDALVMLLSNGKPRG